MLDNEHNGHRAELADLTISEAAGDSVRLRRRDRGRLVRACTKLTTQADESSILLELHRDLYLNVSHRARVNYSKVSRLDELFLESGEGAIRFSRLAHKSSPERRPVARRSLVGMRVESINQVVFIRDNHRQLDQI